VSQKVVPVEMCWFIDGLDEYEGDHEEISELFRAAATSNHKIKICISSRPLLEFEDAFRSCPGLRLQDLTFRDINKYVSDKLANNPRYQKLAESANNKQAAEHLIHEIVTKANGIFLWVTLVVKSLLTGLGNRDGIKDLQRRLRLLPSDLEALYAHMLSRIEPFYQEKASEMFQLIRASRQFKPIHHAVIHRQMTLFALALADEDDYELAISTQAKPWELAHIQERCEIMAARLKCRCAGLLEIQEFDPASQSTSQVNTPTVRPASKVQYLHRTVKDYLEKPDIWSRILAYTAASTFNANSRMLSSCILQMKTYMTSTQSKQLWYAALDAMTYARLADDESTVSNAALLEQLDISMSALYEPPFGGHWSSNSPDNKPGCVRKLGTAIYCLSRYNSDLAPMLRRCLRLAPRRARKRKGGP
jgi:hypothetical protein